MLHKICTFRKFSFFHQLRSIQTNIFTWPIRNFLGVLKSYESESFEYWVLVPWVKFGVPPGTHPSGEFWKSAIYIALGTQRVNVKTTSFVPVSGDRII